MHCADCRNRLTAYAEGLLDPVQTAGVARHLSACPACSAAAAADRRLHDLLRTHAASYAGVDLAPDVLDRITVRRTTGPAPVRSMHMTRRLGLGAGLAAAAAIALAIFVPWGGPQHSQATAADILRQAIAVAADLHSVHLKLNMRTIPGDNFEVVMLDKPPVPVELWKELGPPVRWRAENGGRTVVMDGTGGVGWMLPSNQAYKFAATPNFWPWVGTLLNVDQVLESELRQAQEMGWPLALRLENSSDGSLDCIVTVEARAQGDFTNDWLKNKSISAADNRRVYRFDAASKRLEDLEIWVHAAQGDVLVLETEGITCNEPFSDDLFKLEIPEGTAWFVNPADRPIEPSEAELTPDEVARRFFQAFADKNWDEVMKYYPVSTVPDRLKKAFGGLEIVEIGEPFKSGQYPGWFVPYKIRLPDSPQSVKSFNLAVRNDGDPKHWYVDGGF